MKLEKIWKEPATFEKDGQTVTYDAYHMVIEGVSITFKPSRRDRSLVDYLISKSEGK